MTYGSGLRIRWFVTPIGRTVGGGRAPTGRSSRWRSPAAAPIGHQRQIGCGNRQSRRLAQRPRSHLTLLSILGVMVNAANERFKWRNRCSMVNPTGRPIFAFVILISLVLPRYAAVKPSLSSRIWGVPSRAGHWRSPPRGGIARLIAHRPRQRAATSMRTTRGERAPRREIKRTGHRS